MLGIWFDTPSERDFDKYIAYSKQNYNKFYSSNIELDLQKWNRDFVKLIVNNIWECIWLYNKMNYNYILFNEYVSDKNIFIINKMITIWKKK